MQYFQSGQNFSFNYPAYDGSTGLFVQASIYEITTGSAVFLSNVVMTGAANGVYTGDFAGGLAKSYLVIVVVYTDGTYSVVDTTRPPWAECYQNLALTPSKLFFNYGAYDQATGLFIAAKVYDVTSGLSLITTVHFAHVAFGVYFGSFTGTLSHTYLIQKSVYTDGTYTVVDTSRAPGADSLQVIVSYGAPLPLAFTTLAASIAQSNNLSGFVTDQLMGTVRKLSARVSQSNNLSGWVGLQ